MRQLLECGPALFSVDVTVDDQLRVTVDRLSVKNQMSQVVEHWINRFYKFNILRYIFRNVHVLCIITKFNFEHIFRCQCFDCTLLGGRIL